MRFGLLSLVFVWAQGLNYTQDIRAAFAQAKKAKKSVWIMVSATWCGPCRWAEKNLLPKPWFALLVEKDFVPLKVYAASGPQSTPGADSLAKKYRVNGFPTFLYVNPDGELFYRHIGIMDDTTDEAKARWKALIETALSYREALPTLRKRFQKGDRTPDLVRRYFVWAVACADSETLAPIWQAYLQAFPSIRQAWLYEPRAYEQLFEVASRFEPASAYAFAIADTLKAYLPEGEWLRAYRDLVQVDITSEQMTLLRQGAGEKDLIALSETLLTWARRHPMPFAEEMALEVLAEQLLRPQRTPPEQEAGFRYAVRYHALSKGIEPLSEALRADWANNLNSLAWNACLTYSAPDSLWVAVAWVKDALSYEPDAWYIWDTLGALYYRLGRKKEAIQALTKAISLAKAKGLASSEYEDTETLLQKAQTLSD